MGRSTGGENEVQRQIARVSKQGELKEIINGGANQNSQLT